MKLSRKFAVSAAALAVATSATLVPAMADERPTFIPGRTLSPEAAAAQKEANAKKEATKPTDLEKADLTGKRLDNAQKGVDTAKGIVDTLGGLSGLFGGGQATGDAPAEDNC
ncbi:hypothetical protein H7347_00310 [Corynebacterium sp. zg-331]|uniref:hypothetical protein n=1 Tax=unclassified Corynebacterium TaxID=2624378 RepID=UPI00128B18B6|nr:MULTISPECIES: hypothetical protein [unclassified Corynebacterium]MBC3185039.1 hypothetical protein [Corynebacterium sp. zg-331]MPV51539.1 hypothetical protein [Corynebacterium sp. zg331]